MPVSYLIFSVIGTFSPLIPLSIYFFTRKFQESHMKYVAFLMFWSFVCDFFGMVCAVLIKSAPLLAFFRKYVSPSYTLVSIIMICLLYRSVFPKKYANAIVITMTILGILYFYMNSFSGGVSELLPDAPFGVVAIVFTLSYFFMIMTQMPATHIQRLPMFWINVGFLIYYGGTIFLNLFINYFLDVILAEITNYWIYQISLNITSQILIAVGLWQARPKAISR